MKKILFVIEALHRGGAERALSNICTHFPKDWDIDILINDKSMIGYPYRGNIYSLSRPEKKSFIYYAENILRRTFFLRNLKKNNGYTACVSFLDSANISNVLSGNRYCRTIVSIRTDIIKTKSGLASKVIFLPLTKILFRFADKIVAVSGEIEGKLVYKLRLPPDKVRSVTNGYDCDWIRDRMKEIPIKEKSGKKFIARGQKVIIAIGRMTDQKGHWHLIRAFSKVLKKEPESILLILGDGALKEYLAGLIRAYGLEEKIFLIGYSDNPFWYLANADIFVLPSLYEGYPNALAEAVCCGVPCIASDIHSGAREILAPDMDPMGERVHDISKEEYGILIPVCSGRKYTAKEPLEPEEQKMAEAIIMLLGDGGKRGYYRQKSAERSKDLDINEKVKEWVNIILEKDI